MKCTDCRQQEPNPGLTSRIRLFFFRLFAEDIGDVKSDSFLQGFGDGYKRGYEHRNETMDKELALRDVEVARIRARQDEEIAKSLRDFIAAENYLVDPASVIQVDEQKRIFIDGQRITEADMRQLYGEAKALKEFRLWKILQETVRQKAIEKSIMESTDFEQVLSGKMMIHNLGLMKSILTVIEKHVDGK